MTMLGVVAPFIWMMEDGNRDLNLYTRREWTDDGVLQNHD